MINDGSRLSIVAAGDTLLQLSSPVSSRSEWSRDLERTSEILLERSLHAGQRMAQVHEALCANILETVLVLLINEQGEKEKGSDEQEFPSVPTSLRPF